MTMKRFLAILLVAGCARLLAAETNSPVTPGQMFEGGTNAFNNWVEFSAGGLMTTGNRAQAQQLLQLNHGAFGGIEDLHVQGAVTTNINLTLDGHSILDQRDYSVGLRLENPDHWFLKFNAQNFLNWYNDDGGFYSPSGQFFSRPQSAVAVQRGEFSFEGGLTLKNLPAVTFKYTHWYRGGADNSTIWGPAHPDPNNSTLVRGLYPNLYNLNESADIFELDARHHIKATDLELGLRLETGAMNDTADMTFFPGEPVQQDVTGKTGTSYDLFSVHASSETWVGSKVFFSSGFMFEDLDSTYTGSRIYGDQFGASYTPGLFNGLGYESLNGGAHEQDYVLNLNLMAKPTKTFTLVPSIRVQQEYWDAESGGTGSLGTGTQPFASSGSRGALDVRESLDARYTGFTNWVLWLGGDWTEGQGDLLEDGGLTQVGGIGVPPVDQHTDDTRLFQKYAAGVRWYPLRVLTLDAGGYYKRDRYDYNNIVDSTPNDPASANRYPAYLGVQGLTTYDANFRVTLRPRQNITLVGRYEYQFSTVDTAPDPVSGLDGIESSAMTSHVFGGSASWVPWSRLSLQVGADDVISDTKTPVSSATAAALDAQNGPGYAAAILNSRNNYWTVNASSCFVVDDKTDLNLSYFYYDSDNGHNNSNLALPLGSDSREHGVTVGLTRRLSSRVRLNLRYSYYNFHDLTFGGHEDFTSHLVFSSLQYRF
jgi:hypothetical protein